LSLPRSYASTAINGLSRRNLIQNGIRFAQSYLIGFLRHGWESLNNVGLGRCDSAATSPRVHYSMLPTSGYSSTGCSPAEPVSASPDTCNSFGPGPKSSLLEIVVSTLVPGLRPKATCIEGLVIFQHGPGDNQQLGGKLNPHLGLDAPLPDTALQHPVK